MSRLFVGSLILAGSLSAVAAPVKYSVDPMHSKIGFSVRHMMISNVEGSFKDFTGTFTFDDAKDAVTAATFTAQTASIDTGNGKRDEHLKSPDFFDAAKYPTITFTETKLKKTSADHWDWSGNLTMHGVTKPVTFKLEHAGTQVDPQGNSHAGFEANATIKRSDWGLKWNKPLEKGAGVMVGDDVKLKLEVEAVQSK